jgi:hypothetical protein
VIRLGFKYEIAHLRRDAIRLLSKVFPTTLERWGEIFEPDTEGAEFNLFFEAASFDLHEGDTKETAEISGFNSYLI